MDKKTKSKPVPYFCIGAKNYYTKGQAYDASQNNKDVYLKECIVDGKKYELPPDILGNKDKYEFLKWDCQLGDAVIFDMRTLHGTLSSIVPKKTLSRYTLRVAKEDTKINYVGDWTSYNYRKAMQDGGYKEGDSLGGKMFPTLFEVC